MLERTCILIVVIANPVPLRLTKENGSRPDWSVIEPTLAETRSLRLLSVVLCSLTQPQREYDVAHYWSYVSLLERPDPVKLVNCAIEAAVPIETN